MREYIHNNTELKSVSGDWGVWHRYTYGVAGERFFREMKDKGQLTASVCPKCRKIFLPANLYCEDCFVEMSEYKPVGGTGTVVSFTVLHESLEETPLPEPIIAAFVTIDGAVGGLLAPLKGVKPEHVRIGMKVKPKLSTTHPTNTIRDLSWEPV